MFPCIYVCRTYLYLTCVARIPRKYVLRSWMTLIFWKVRYSGATLLGYPTGRKTVLRPLRKFW